MLRVWKFDARPHSQKQIAHLKKEMTDVRGETQSTSPSIKGSTWRSGRCSMFTSRKTANPIPQLHELMNFTKLTTFQSIGFAFWQHLSLKLDFRNVWLQARSPHELCAATQNPPFQVALGRDHWNDQHSLEHPNLIPQGSELEAKWRCAPDILLPSFSFELLRPLWKSRRKWSKTFCCQSVWPFLNWRSDQNPDLR
jgi:hypothetical protein